MTVHGEEICARSTLAPFLLPLLPLYLSLCMHSKEEEKKERSREDFLLRESERGTVARGRVEEKGEGESNFPLGEERESGRMECMHIPTSESDFERPAFLAVSHLQVDHAYDECVY